LKPFEIDNTAVRNNQLERLARLKRDRDDTRVKQALNAITVNAEKGTGNLLELCVEAYQKSLNDPDGFWGEIAQNCHWYKKWDKVLDDSNKPFYRWFSGGEINTCYNALDCHIDKRGDQLALIYDSPVTGTIKKFTYRELRDEVANFAGLLALQGIVKGDRVLIYMPMIPQAAIAMLACARLGAVHSVVFGGFAPNELATRIKDAKPKVIVSASCGIEGKKIIEYKPMLDEAISLVDEKTA
jgi:Acyl-coenzyme A synthetases/AMP-(fatty) acid ligases